MSDEIVYLRTCKVCSHDNPSDASVCNGCGRSLNSMFGTRYYERWVCPRDNRINMKDNSRCVCGYKKSGDGWAVIAVIVIIALIFIFSGK